MSITLIRSLALAGALSLSLSAQPSGGPYGPVDRRYEVPKAPHVYYVAPDGKPDATGQTLAEPTTLAAAIERVVTGDAVIFRGGVYRTGGLSLNQGITLQPYESERPVIKGTLLATQWERLPNNVWRTPWKTLFPAAPLSWWQRRTEGVRTPLHRFNNDMVFIDGESLMSAGWEGELDAHKFFIDYQSGYVYIGADPANRQVEITAFDGAIYRTSGTAHGKPSDRKGPIIRGLTFTQYAYRALEIEGKKRFTSADEPTDEPLGPSDPATYGKEVTGTLLENVTITHCSRVAGYFRGDGLVIRNSLISDTTTEGIYVIGSSDVLLEHNIVRRNNVEHVTGYYASAVKIFNQSHRVTVRDNLILDNPESAGVWFDVGNRDGVFTNNYVENAINGFMFEISRGVTVTHNVFVRCNRGVYILNAADARVDHNTFLDAPASFERNQRSASGDRFGWHPATGPGVDQREGHVFTNNLVASESYNGPLTRVEQPAAMCTQLPKPMLKQSAGNIYVRPTPAPALITWSPASGADACTAKSATLPAFQAQASGYESGSRELNLTPRSVFKGIDLYRFDLQQPLPAGAY